MADRIDIQTVGYGNSGDGFAPNATTYTARNLPALLSYGASTTGVWFLLVQMQLLVFVM